jgi:carbon-monoxide dehydrogenase large subunit
VRRLWAYSIACAAYWRSAGLPRADNLPPLEITLAELPTAVNPLGVKGAGQAGCMAAPQTIINAILDALAPLGVAHVDMPASLSGSGARSAARSD